jgi:hypothetical protein
MIHDDPHTAALLYERGRLEIASVDPESLDPAYQAMPPAPDDFVPRSDYAREALAAQQAAEAERLASLDFGGAQ